jgi:hypothetical protein
MNSPKEYMDEDNDHDEEMTDTDVNDTEVSYKHEIKGEAGNQYVLFDLRKGETITALSRPMFIKGEIREEAKTQPFNCIEYKAVSDTASIALGCSYQNTILKMNVENKVIYVSKNNILAFTNNMIIEPNKEFMRYENGIILLSAYGNYEDLDLTSANVVNSGIYLMSSVQPLDNGAGNYKFASSTTIKIQTKNVKSLNKQTSQSTSVTPPLTVSQTPVVAGVSQGQQQVPQGQQQVPQGQQQVPQGQQQVPQGQQQIPQGQQQIPQGQQQVPQGQQQQSSKSWFQKIFTGGGGPEYEKEINMRKVLRSI